MLNQFLVSALSCLLFVGVPAQGAAFPARNVIDKIQPALLKKLSLKQDSRLPALVFLREAASLDSVKKYQTKDERAQYVYETLRDKALHSQKGLVQFLKGQRVDFQQFYIVNMIAVDSLNQKLLFDLAAREDVKSILDNPSSKMSFPGDLKSRADPMKARGPGDNLLSVGAPQVWQEFKIGGQGIVVAGQDTGVQFDHPALIKQYRGNLGARGFDHSYSWHDAIKKPVGTGNSNPCGYNSVKPCDDDQHGTHTMGTVVGFDGAENQIGMAPAAKWIACRNMDSGYGSPQTYLECFEYFLAPYPQAGFAMRDGNPKMAPHVINNSWGCPESEGCKGPEYEGAIRALEAAGIMVVVSAGNDGPSCSTIQDPPAHYTDLTLSVGAVDHRSGKIAYFSSRGPSKFDKGLGPDVSAPGVNIRSAVPGSAYAQSNWSGTSMAGPHVVGEVALIWSANPNYIGRIKETLDLIRKTSTPKTSTETCGNVAGTEIPNNTYGFGIINAYQAVKKAKGL